MKTLVLESLFNKVVYQKVLYQKESPTQLFTCEHCKIFKSSFVIKHGWLLSRPESVIYIL